MSRRAAALLAAALLLAGAAVALALVLALGGDGEEAWGPADPLPGVRADRALVRVSPDG